MAFWDIDLTTRMGAESAADNGGLACYVKAGFMVFGAFVFGGMAGFDTTEGQIIIAMQLAQVVVFAIAGFRMRSGKGAFWGMAAAALLVLIILDTLIAMTYGGIIINTVLLVVVVQGVRGAMALRSSAFSEDDLETFE